MKIVKSPEIVVLLVEQRWTKGTLKIALNAPFRTQNVRKTTKRHLKTTKRDDVMQTSNKHVRKTTQSENIMQTSPKHVRITTKNITKQRKMRMCCKQPQTLSNESQKNSRLQVFDSLKNVLKKLG